jgi:hypothetical protein
MWNYRQSRPMFFPWMAVTGKRRLFPMDQALFPFRRIKFPGAGFNQPILKSLILGIRRSGCRSEERVHIVIGKSRADNEDVFVFQAFKRFSKSDMLLCVQPTDE